MEKLSEMRWQRLLLAVTASLLLAGCAGKLEPLVSSAELQVVPGTELPPPFGTAAEPDGYAIGVFDRLIIDVVGFEELAAREVQVDAAGRISVPIAGSVSVAGKSPAQAAEEIANQLRASFVRNPQVAVNLDESTSQYVTVEGEVKQPGNYPMAARMTLMRSVAAARGVDEFAQLDDVVVFRTVEGRRMAALYNLGAIRRGLYADPAIYAQDIIVVGDSPGRRLFSRIVAASGLVTAPIIALITSGTL